MRRVEDSELSMKFLSREVVDRGRINFIRACCNMMIDPILADPNSPFTVVLKDSAVTGCSWPSGIGIILSGIRRAKIVTLVVQSIIVGMVDSLYAGDEVVEASTNPFSIDSHMTPSVYASEVPSRLNSGRPFECAYALVIGIVHKCYISLAQRYGFHGFALPLHLSNPQSHAPASAAFAESAGRLLSCFLIPYDAMPPFAGIACTLAVLAGGAVTCK